MKKQLIARVFLAVVSLLSFASIVLADPSSCGGGC